MRKIADGSLAPGDVRSGKPAWRADFEPSELFYSPDVNWKMWKAASGDTGYDMLFSRCFLSSAITYIPIK